MKEFRTTLILFVAVLLLGGWIFLREREPLKEGFSPVRVAPDDVTELTVRNEISRAPVVLRKEKNTWWIAKPLRTRADQDIVKTALDHLKDLTATQDVTEDLQGRDLSEYRLKDRPRATLTVRLQSGRTHTLRFGDKTIDGQSVYMKLGDERIVLVQSTLFNDINTRDADGFRDKKILTLDHDKIERVTLHYPDQVVEIKRKGARDWQLTRPIKTDADFSAADGLVSKLETLAAVKFVEEDPKHLGKYGLDKPPFRIEVWVKGRKKAYEVRVGKEGTGEHINHTYARTNIAKPVVLLPGYLVNDLKQDVKTLRSKTVVSLIPNDVKRLRLTYAGQKPVEVEKTKQETIPEWHLKQPVEGPADRQTVENVLFSLNGQVADDFIDRPAALAPYGLEPPQVEAALWMSDSKEPTHVVRIGKKVKDDKGEGVFAQVKGSDTVYKVAGAQWVDSVKVSVAQLRDKQILRFDIPDAEKFTLLFDRKKVEVERRDVNHWEVTAPQRVEADSIKVNTLLETVSDLRGEAFIASNPSPADLKKYGLDKPEAIVEVFLKGEAANKRRGAQILVSKESEQNQVYVFRRHYQPTVYRAGADLLDSLKQDVKDLKKER